MSAVDRKTIIPALGRPTVSNPKSVQDFLNGVYTTLQVGTGRLGSPLDRYLTIRDLYESGVVRLIDGTGFTVYTGSNPTGMSPIPPPATEPDLTAPPAPTGLSVTGAITINILQWTAASYGNHAYTEIWRNTTDNQGTAVNVGTTRASMYPDPIGYNSATYYYWIRFVSTAPVTGPFNATAGTSGTTQSGSGGTDTTAPGVLTSLTATGAFRGIILTWVLPSDNDINVVQVWRASSNDRAGASKVAEVKGTIYPDPVAIGSTYYYWVRAVDSSGNVGDWNAGATSGVVGTTTLIGGTDLNAGIIDITKFASSITAIKFVTSLPTLPDANYPSNSSVVMNTTNGRMYRNLSNAWEEVFHEVVASKITSGTISAGLIYLGGTQFELDGANKRIIVKDEQGTPVTRVALGKLGAGATDYGIQIYDNSGNLIVGATGLGASIVGMTQISQIAIDDAKVVGNLTASRIAAGTLTAGVVNIGDDRLQLDGTGTNRHILVQDNQGTPVTRVKFGKLGAGTSDYGIQIFDASGNPVIALDGTVYGAKVNELAAAKVLAGKLTGHDIVGAWFSTVNYDYTASSPQYTHAAYRVEIEDGSTLPIWYGNNTKNTANGKFYVTDAGVVVVNGKLYSVEGQIAGFNLSSSVLYAGSGNNIIKLDAAGTNPAIAIGHATPTSAPFRAYMDGSFVATNATITGSITITGGSGYANISDKPTSLSGINSGEGTKLSGIEAGADVTAGHTAGRGVNIMHPRYASFEEGALPPVAVANGTATLETSITYFGGKSLKLVASAADNYCYLGSSTTDYNIKLTSGKKWIVSCYVYSPQSNAPGQFGLITSNAAAQYRPSFQASSAQNTWSRVSAVIDLTADTSTSAIGLAVNASNGYTMYFDGLMVEEQVGTVTTPSAYNEPGAPITALSSGLVLSSGFIKNGENINIDFANKKITINDPTYGNAGIQFEYNGGTPRAHIGDGTAHIKLESGSILAREFKTAASGKRIAINEAGDNEIRFYGDRGDGVVEELSSIGINTDATFDTHIGYFGSSNTTHTAIRAISAGTAIYASSASVGSSAIACEGWLNVYGGEIISTDLSSFTLNSSNDYGTPTIPCKYVARFQGAPIILSIPNPAVLTGKPNSLSTAGAITLRDAAIAWINTAGVQGSEQASWMRIADQYTRYSGSHTTASLASSASETINVTHGLGTDDVIVEVSGIGNSFPGDWTVCVGLPDDFQQTFKGSTTSTSFVAPATPSSGQTAIRIRNVNASAQTISIRYVIRPRT